MLFDEPNSSLDAESDAQLKDVMERLKGECTLLLVSHRPSLLRIADRGFNLENGRLRAREPAAQAVRPALMQVAE